MNNSLNFDNPKFKYLEFYSNCILSFIVLQGLAFCYAFGTQEFFNKRMKEHEFIMSYLIVLFSLILIGAIVLLIQYKKISKSLFEAKEDKKIVSLSYYGKIIISFIFGTLPIVILIIYG